MIYRSGDLTLDTTLYRLLRNGEQIEVEPQVFDVLVYLIENRDRVVSRSELLNNLWKGRVVSDSALSGRLKAVRKAIGDTGSTQGIIKTVHGRGYQFIAQVVEGEGPGKSVEIEADTARHPSLPRQGRPSIAVLPFKNMSGDPEQEYFSDGISSDIVSALSYFRNMHVVAFHSTYVYKTREASISDIAREQGAAYILEGRVRKGGNKIRISTELIDSSSGSICWSETYDRELDDIFAVQDEITMSIVAATKVHLADGQRAREMAQATGSLKAWECCIRAGELGDSYIRENILEARRLIALSLEADPGYSTAWATLGWINWQEAYIAAKGDMRKFLDAAHDAAARALEIDPRETRTLTLQAFTHQLLGDDPRLVIDKMDQALALAPGNAEVLALAAYSYFYVHRLDVAMDLYKSSARLSPILPNWMLLVGANIYQRRGELGTAIPLYQQSIGAEPESPLTYYFLIDAYLESGNEAKAKEVADTIRSLGSDMNVSGAILAFSYDQQERDRLRSNLSQMGFSES